MLTPKFVRSHVIGDVAQGQGFSWFFKLIYEFWGFCVNGGNSLTEAGGFVPNELTGTSMPDGFQNGTGSLIASGTDGYTEAGMPFFKSLNLNAFSASYVGKHIVVWKSGSTSTDDSIYPITQWINSSTIRVDVLAGGTPYSASLHPSFSTRNNINYRIIDFSAAAALPGYTTNDYLVLQFNGAPLVNPGQRLSQARLRRNTTYGGSGYNCSIQLSPSGSWRAAGFESGSYASGSWSSGSMVNAPGDFKFYMTSSMRFTGSFVDTATLDAGTTTGSLIVGEASGTYTVLATNVLSGNFYLISDPNQPVISGTALFTGTLNGTGSLFALTGTFAPGGSYLYSGTFAFSGSGVFSGSGLFTGQGNFITASFADPTAEINATSNGGGWGIGSMDNPAWVTLIGSTDFLISHFKTPALAGGSGFHIEIPQRLYPQGVDPNPIAAMNYGVYAPNHTDANGHHYGTGFRLHNPPDGSLMTYYSFARRVFGNADGTNPIGNATNGRYNGAYFNTFLNKFLFMDIILGRPDIAGQYQLGRVRLRRVRVMPPIAPGYQRIGNNGEWIHIGNGVLWPWDNALLPHDLLLGGA